jgi:hypothetical protein
MPPPVHLIQTAASQLSCSTAAGALEVQMLLQLWLYRA